MKATLDHVGINLSNDKESFRFWKELSGYLELKIILDEEGHFHANLGNSYLCVCVTDPLYTKNSFHRKRTGLNHIAFRVPSREHVDTFVSEFLVPRNIPALYGGARAYPEYTEGYYAVYFEDPDRIKVEVVYEPVVQFS